MKSPRTAAVCGVIPFLIATSCLAAATPATPSADLYVESGIRHSARSVAFSPDGRLIAAGSLDRTIKVWDVRTGRELVTLPNGSMSTSLAFLPSGLGIAAAGEDGSISFWDVRTGMPGAASLRCSQRPSPSLAVDAKASALLCADWEASEVRRWDLRDYRPLPPIPVSLKGMGAGSSLSADGTLLTIDGPDGRLQIVDTQTSEVAGTLPTATANVVEAIAFAPRSGKIAEARLGGPLTLWSWAGFGEARNEQPIAAELLHAITFSPDEKLIAYAAENGDIVVIDAVTQEVVQRLGSRANRIEGAGLTSDFSILAVHTWYDTHMALNLKSGSLIFDGAPTISYENASEFVSEGELSDRRFVITKEEDRVRFNKTDGQPIGTLVVLDKIGAWVVVDPMGRFDTNMDLTDVKGVHWVVDGRALEPLPLEILMRDYYQPRLLPRLLAGLPLTDPPPLASLNRIQPEVKVISVRPGSSADMALVEVEVAGKEDKSQPIRKMTTAAYDLRLYRNGQLVGQWSDPTSCGKRRSHTQEGSAGAIDAGTQRDLDAWRRSNCISATENAGKVTHTFSVRLASRDRSQPVTFTAYAFNEDRVKSETAMYDPGYRVPDNIASRTARAYVIAVGVNTYDNPGRNLSFAARDARALVGALRNIEGYEIVPVPLISAEAGEGGVREELRQATKKNIRAVLDLLAGKGEGERSQLRREVGSVADDLREASPDDLVILTFSGHGYTDPQSRFYLVPTDSGAGADITAAVSQLISSEELTAWLREVDAGEAVMVIDACHSAGSVDTPGFKPGPMGDRGLGQLAYDKGMRILAATQANDVALESGQIGQGLLTYALVEDGLRRGLASSEGSGRVTLPEWLRYGERRVPSLYEEIRTGKLRLLGAQPEPAARSIELDSLATDNAVRRAQTPALFDFHRQSNEVILRRP